MLDSKAGVDAGAKELQKEIKVMNQYAGDFSAPETKGRSIARGMYAQNAGSHLRHASGGTG